MRWLLCLFLVTVAAAAAEPGAEIEALLAYVGNLDGAAFLRNGSSHTPAEAASHLRLKWSNQRGGIATAEDFVRLCGTKSSLSGRAYLIRFADGREEPAAQVLLRQLQVIRRAPSTSVQTKKTSRFTGVAPVAGPAAG